MLFQTLHYLVFLVLVVGLYWAVPYKYRLSVLGIASLIFYGSWNIAYLPLLLLISLAAWGFGHWINKKERSALAFAGSIFIMFCPLIVFKYWDWIIENIEFFLSWFQISSDLPSRSDYNIILPVGISFFTFQAVSYIVDTKREGKEEKNSWRFFTFIAFFPQLIAGPIVRRHELLPQLRKPLLLAKGDTGEALFRITKGMIKKLLIADVLYNSMIDQVFKDPSSFIGIELWLALYAYTIWIYYDFSAYTDIAIGSAKLFGIKLPENFNRPYQASSVAEFWRKWHITLSNWVRDYIYYPLGGARTDSEWKIYRNIIATMVVIGIWHGASWNFVIYGILHGSAVSFNRLQRKVTNRRPGDPFTSRWSWFWRFFLTFHFVVLARILFGTANLSDAWQYLIRLFDVSFVLPRFYSPSTFALLLFGYFWHFTPKKWTNTYSKNVFIALPAPAQALLAALAAAICWKMNSSSAIAFAYYQF